jgi:hypothetical protein
VKDNVSFNPKLDVPSLKIKVVGYSADDKTEMTVGNDGDSGDKSTDNIKDKSVEEGGMEFKIDTSQLGSQDSNEPADSKTEITPVDTEVDSSSAREVDSYIDGNSKNYAPRFSREKAALFPANPEAEAYGASAARITTYE